MLYVVQCVVHLGTSPANRMHPKMDGDWQSPQCVIQAKQPFTMRHLWR